MGVYSPLFDPRFVTGLGGGAGVATSRALPYAPGTLLPSEAVYLQGDRVRQAMQGDPVSAQVVGDDAARQAGLGGVGGAPATSGGQAQAALAAMTGQGGGVPAQGTIRTAFGDLTQEEIDQLAMQGAERAQAIEAERDRQQALDAIRSMQNPFDKASMQEAQDAALLGMRIGNIGQDRSIYANAEARGMGGSGQTAQRGAALEGAQQAAMAARSADIYDRFTQGRAAFEQQRATQEAGILQNNQPRALALDALQRMRGDTRFAQGQSMEQANLEDAIARDNLKGIVGGVATLGGTILGGPAGGAIAGAGANAIQALAGMFANKQGAGGAGGAKAQQQGPSLSGAPLGGNFGVTTPAQSINQGMGAKRGNYRVGWGVK